MTRSILQAGVIAVRGEKVCLISSRNRSRWVIPKGHIDAGYTAPEAALLEAWEEAGLTATTPLEPFGEFRYDKGGRDYFVSVFLLTNPVESDVWPEASERARAWFPVPIALEHVSEPGLRGLIRLVGCQRVGV